MPIFGEISRRRLDSCHPDLQRICERVIEVFDFSVLEGERTMEQQQKYFSEGKSRLDGINQKSKHQHRPSLAVDIAPYPLDWSQREKARARFYHMAGFMFMAADELKNRGIITHQLRWGGDWDGDKDFADQSFDDLPHFELVKPV